MPSRLAASTFLALTCAGMAPALTLEQNKPEPIMGKHGFVFSPELIRYVDLITGKDAFRPIDGIDTYLGGKAGHLTSIDPMRARRRGRTITWENEFTPCDCDVIDSFLPGGWYTTTTTTETVTPDPEPSAVWIGPNSLALLLTGLFGMAAISHARLRAKEPTR